MHSLTTERLAQLTFDTHQLKSIRAIGDARGQQALWYQQVPEILRDLRTVAIIESTESSNRIEGVSVPPERLAPLVLKQTEPTSRSEQEIAGYRDALALIHESGPDMPFTANVIRQLHGTICRYMADPGGDWKHTSNNIVERHPNGTERVRFTPTPPHLTPMQIETLSDRFAAAKASGQEPLILIPLAILDFLCVHPFLDGNGRVGRLLTLMLLYQAGYEVGRYISLERIIEQSKETYYEALEASSQGWHEARHDVMPWLNYFWGVLIRAYREFGERTRAAKPQTHGSKSEQVRFIVLRQQTPFTLSEIEAQSLGVSRDMVRHVLRQMRDEQLVEVLGRGRGARWQLTRHTTGDTRD